MQRCNEDATCPAAQTAGPTARHAGPPAACASHSAADVTSAWNDGSYHTRHTTYHARRNLRHGACDTISAQRAPPQTETDTWREKVSERPERSARPERCCDMYAIMLAMQCCNTSGRTGEGQNSRVVPTERACVAASSIERHLACDVQRTPGVQHSGARRELSRCGGSAHAQAAVS